MRYIPTSPDERISMLREIGCERIEDLFDQVPESLRMDRPIGIGHPMSEPELIEFFNRLASKNGTTNQFFLGAVLAFCVCHLAERCWCYRTNREQP